MNKPQDEHVTDKYSLKDADDNNGIVPDDALQKVNPAAADKAAGDHDPHNVAKNDKQYDSSLMENEK